MRIWDWRLSSCAGVATLVLAVGCAPSSTAEPDRVEAAGGAADWTPPPLSEGDADFPDAQALVRRMAEFVGGQPEVMMEAMITYGATQESGQVLHFDELQRLAMRRPDQLAWVTLNSDGTTQSAWLSGGQFTLLKQPANMFGTISVPRAIPGAIARLVDEYQVIVPFEDLLGTDPADRWIGENTTSVEYVGEEWVQGSWTDHVALRKPGIDFEVWIRQGSEPFPAKMLVVFVGEEGRPSHTARFRRWSTTLPDGDATFEFIAPEGAQQVEVAPVARP